MFFLKLIESFDDNDKKQVFLYADCILVRINETKTEISCAVEEKKFLP